MFALIDMVIFNTECSEKLFDKVVETLVLIAPVLEYKIVGQPPFVQKRCGDGILSVEVLGKQKRGEGLFYELELGIEGPVIEMDLFDNRLAFDVVVTVVEL
ncbi:hypothetical protein [Sulfurovum sp. NBC37-1]|uniref:hypothetical protein n=1 Tax=Sulfurovum sp. (strain NBC37-1) TaxID=387093 RepID=UPI0005A1CBB5|nr:hypothetical protein [Sulfurovum sp. NBC37-1]